MTDLTEMVEWLTATVRGDLEAAKADLAHEAATASMRTWGGTWPKGSPITEDRIDRHDPRDTIARCEAELKLIDSFAHWDHSGRLADLAAELHWSILGQVVQHLAYGRRHRPGWKAEWKS